MEWLELLILEALSNLSDSVILCDSVSHRKTPGVRLQLPHSEFSLVFFPLALS